MGVVGIGGAILGLAASLVGPDLVANAIRKELAGKATRDSDRDRDQPGESPDTRALMGVYTTRKFLGLALLEGAALLNAIVSYLEGKTPALLAALVLVGAMMARFPTRPTVETWIDRQSVEHAQERHLG